MNRCLVVHRHHTVPALLREDYQYEVQMAFFSRLNHVGEIVLPPQSGIQVMMMPILLEDINSLPDYLSVYGEVYERLIQMSPKKKGVAYLTIDEKSLKAGECHRRPGLHVDGLMGAKATGSFGGGGWAYTGMLTVSNVTGCRAWGNSLFNGYPGDDGDCQHLAEECPESQSTLLLPNQVYLLGWLCVHESIPVDEDCWRTFLRLSMPSDCPWFEGYTRNPKGIEPTGPILPRRKYQNRDEVLLASKGGKQ